MGRAWPLFGSLKKNPPKMWPLNSMGRGDGGKALEVGPLKKCFFCGFPKYYWVDVIRIPVVFNCWLRYGYFQKGLQNLYLQLIYGNQKPKTFNSITQKSISLDFSGSGSNVECDPVPCSNNQIPVAFVKIFLFIYFWYRAS